MSPPDPAVSPTTTDTKAVEPKRSPKTVAASVAGGLLALFAVFNLQTVKIHWIVGSTRTPLVVLIAICGALGFGAGWLVSRHMAGRAKAKQD
jgi:uncharacterized integral membrane protein